MTSWKDTQAANGVDSPPTMDNAAAATDIVASVSAGFAELQINSSRPPRRLREYGTILSCLLSVLAVCFSSVFFWAFNINFGHHLTRIELDPEPTMTSEEAWAALVAANQEKDLDDFKVFFLEYCRNNKHLTFVDLENKFREEGLDVYLIAMVFRLPHPCSS